jgi:hypothetical protein
MANPLPVIEDPTLQSQPGYFGVTVSDSGLSVPSDLFRLLKEYNITTAADMLSSLDTQTGAFAIGLGWRMDEVGKATASLKTQLRNRVDPDFLLSENEHKARLEPRRYGAFGSVRGGHSPTV